MEQGQAKVEEILMTIKNKKWAWAICICRADNRWTAKVRVATKNGKRGQGRQKTWLINDISIFWRRLE